MASLRANIFTPRVKFALAFFRRQWLARFTGELRHDFRWRDNEIGNRKRTLQANKLCQHMKVRRLWFCTRGRQHRVNLTPMVGLVIEELNNTECSWLLDPS